MEFLNLALIGGVALGGVPVIIHLLNRRRYRETIWAAMEFLREAVQENARRMRLEDLLLLLLRVLALVLLAVALARPTLTGRWAGMPALARQSSTAAIIVLDTSYSMGAVEAGEPVFTRARDLARTIVRTLPRGSGSSAAVLAVNDRVEPIVGRLSQDLNAVEQAIGGVTVSDGGTDFLAALTMVRDVLLPDVKAARVEVHVITDGQRRPWTAGGEPLARLIAEIAEKADLHIEALSPGDTENLAVAALTVPDLASTDRRTQDVLPSIHAPTLFQAAVVNIGRTEREYVPVDLLVDGTVRDRQVIRRVRPDETRSATFRVHIRTPGSHRVEAQVDVGATDRLPADNVRLASVHVYEEVRVLVVDGDPRPEAFESESDFLRLALSPVDLDAPDAPFLITTEVCAREELEGARLADYAVVALANVAGVSRSLAGRLARFVRDGGGLMVFLGDQVDAADYNDILFADGRGLLPAKLLNRIGFPGEPDRAFGLVTGNLTHYLVNNYEPTDPTLSRVRVQAALNVRPEGVPDAEVVLRYTNGRPFIVTRPVGLGRVILFTTTADKDWTNLPAQNAFVPLMQRSINYLVFGRKGPTSLNLLTGRPFLYRLRPDETACEVRITDPAGNPRAFPGQAGRDRIQWTDTWRAGFYRVDLAANPPRTDYFAVNRETAESDLALIGEADLRRLLGGVSLTWTDSVDNRLAADLRRRRIGTEVWPYLLGLVIALLVAEAVIARALSLRGT